ncbi:tetraacyldisaccharide 4'-kinase [Lysobacter solisilvae (ex Woo and Kim 2020)]|uniref:Tetraacyldisaccharide 4'-kinase n=1 Tax=Agrilutibacter terrestris TaxID=2865112 RepID=A0A7H0FY15_9GAMM|nr:tetraacyldisaccharide 4'-kinase [Lysobacter terrestris]QNP40931.1 tetraacyldisaccharide 4'-kinase [Lysobacter terrestris]
MVSRQRPAYWYGEARVPLGARMLSAIYAGITGLRRRLYEKGILRARRSEVPVLVVGNISVGGTGKTPLTIAIVQRLQAEGFKPGVASRGYGREEPSQPRWVDRESNPAKVGDEPALIAHHTGAKLRVDRDRVAAAKALVKAGCDVVVCDDGLQHYRLARDIEIEVIDGRLRYGNAQRLPAGPLREPVERAQRCDFRVVNLGSSAAQASNVGAGFGEWPMRLQAEHAAPITGGRSRTLASFSGQRVHAVAGIGDPERFFAMLRAAGIAVVPHAFDDHHRYTSADFEFGSRLPVLMTEKDAVKCANIARDDWLSIPVRAELPEAFWVALLDKLRAARA